MSHRSLAAAEQEDSILLSTVVTAIVFVIYVLVREADGVGLSFYGQSSSEKGGNSELNEGGCHWGRV